MQFTRKSTMPCIAIAALLALFWQQASAHHSFAQRLAGEIQSVVFFEGEIELYKMLNPHSALIINAVNDDGEQEDWLIELSSASTLGREGWTDEFLSAGEQISVAILAARTPNRGRLRAMLVHGATERDDSRLIVAYGIRGDTPIMQRLRERLPTCDGIEGRLDRGECFIVTSNALRSMEDEFPGRMGYVMP